MKILNLSQMHLLEKALCWQPVGSSVTCDPAPEDCDFDYLLLVPKAEVDKFCNILSSEGFEIEMGDGYAADILKSEQTENAFNSFRCDDVNFIVTCSFEFYEKFCLATLLAKRFNLLKKSDRIALFQGLLYGNVIYS